MRILLAVLAGALLFATLLAPGGAAAEAIAVAGDTERYPPPRATGRCRRLPVAPECRGRGGPTVLLDVHLRRLVQPLAARPARARRARPASVPGIAPALGGVTSGCTTIGQRTSSMNWIAFCAQRISRVRTYWSPPVYGGRVARLFTAAHPSAVVGLVFVDAVHESAFGPAEAARAEQDRASTVR